VAVVAVVDTKVAVVAVVVLSKLRLELLLNLFTPSKLELVDEAFSILAADRLWCPTTVIHQLLLDSRL
jgi:hypothetical protein